MKLYYAPGACSMSVHIALNELGMKYELVPVDMAKKEFKGTDYKTVNPKGAVPALQLENGDVLTECAVILQYLADQNPGKGLMPHPGTMERYRCQEWLNYIAAEVHKGLGIFFIPNLTADERERWLKAMDRKFNFLENHFKTHDFLMGQKFTLADAYLFTILNWTGFKKISLASFPAVRGYMDRVRNRPSIPQTMKEEGLL